MRISITLPSLHPELLERTLGNIAEATTRHRVEVIAVSPFPVRHAGVVWVEEQEPRGNVPAHAAAFRHATGDFITAFVDDHAYVEGWDELAVEGYLRRAGDQLFILGLRQAPHTGQVFGRYYAYFPFMRLEDAHAVGGWYDPRYRHGFGDCDLGLRVWAAAGRCEPVHETTIVTLPADATPSRYEDDMPVFLERWAATHGAGYDLSHLRGFNVDVPG